MLREMMKEHEKGAATWGMSWIGDRGQAALVPGDVSPPSATSGRECCYCSSRPR